ncbi:MAG: winged helix DNA-binding protein [Candidatus Thorarchaeota archaeon]|jgi:DNA-binding MarR family transcriptional regulator
MSNNLTRSEQAVLRLILKKEMIRSDELYEQLSRMSTRAISTAIASLKERGLVRRFPDLMDARRALYTLSEELASRLRAKMESPIVP